MISLRVDLATREVKVVVSCDDVGETRSRLLSCCVGDKRLNVRDDPFILFCCAYSAIMDIWAVSDKPISAFLKTKVSEAGCSRAVLLPLLTLMQGTVLSIPQRGRRQRR